MEVKPPPLELLSDIGLIIDDIACGFLYTTNSKLGILEAFISNPYSDKNDRDLALNRITLDLIDIAKSKGIKVLKCDTKIDAIVNRAIKFGFVNIGQFKTLIKEI